MGKEMTLYFTIFETVSLFVSVFVVNFLVLDGRSNYLEGALLMSAYVIIGVAAFFYPEERDQSIIGGNPDADDPQNATSTLVKMAVHATLGAVLQ
jgi:Ca2+:H+ antiporter